MDLGASEGLRAGASDEQSVLFQEDEEIGYLGSLLEAGTGSIC